VGAPPGNKNAQTHGLYSQDETNPDSLREIQARLRHRLERLERYLDDNWDNLDPDTIARLTALQGQTASRCVKIERDLKRLETETGGEDMDDLLREAYEIAEEILQVDLGMGTGGHAKA